MLNGSYTVYRDVLESRMVGRTFNLVNPKHKKQASVCNDFLSLNVLVAGLKYINSVSFIFNLTKILFL